MSGSSSQAAAANAQAGSARRVQTRIQLDMFHTRNPQNTQTPHKHAPVPGGRTRQVLFELGAVPLKVQGQDGGAPVRAAHALLWLAWCWRSCH